MCGRFTLTRKGYDELLLELEAEPDPSLVNAPGSEPVVAQPEPAISREVPAPYRPRFNVAPTDWHWILRQGPNGRQLAAARWGLQHQWTQPKSAPLINGRIETVDKSGAFRSAFYKRRCLVPADGFFEWAPARAEAKAAEGKAKGKAAKRPVKRPVWFHQAHHGLLLFAGVFESVCNPETGIWRRTFSILTMEAAGPVSAVHNRMPVVVPMDRRELIASWIAPLPEVERVASDAAAELKGAVTEASRVAVEHGLYVPTWVSPRVNSVRNDDAECLTPETEPSSEPEGQLDLL